MIFDNLKNKEIYYSINKGFKLGFDFIEKALKENFEIGKYEIDSKNVYAIVQKYDSKDEAKWEAHRNYIDIQYIVDGNERMLYSNLDDCKSIIEYNSEKDVEFFDAKAQGELICASQTFAIFFPNDVHKPGLKIENNSPVYKIVVKVRV